MEDNKSSNSNDEREDLVFYIKLAEQADLPDDMWQAIKRLAKLDGEFSDEERHLFVMAMMGHSRRFRVAYREVSSQEMKLEAKGKDRQWELCQMYSQKLKEEFKQILLEAINIINNDLLPKTRTDASKASLYKLKGQYWLDIADVSQDQAKIDAINNTKISYEAGLEYTKPLDILDPVKLGFINAYSIFLYERLNDPLLAISTASEVFHAAIKEIDRLDEYSPDVTTILQVMRDNITLWTSDGEFDPKGGQRIQQQPSDDEDDEDDE